MSFHNPPHIVLSPARFLSGVILVYQSMLMEQGNIVHLFFFYYLCDRTAYYCLCSPSTADHMLLQNLLKSVQMFISFICKCISRWNQGEYLRWWGLSTKLAQGISWKHNLLWTMTKEKTVLLFSAPSIPYLNSGRTAADTNDAALLQLRWNNLAIAEKQLNHLPFHMLSTELVTKFRQSSVMIKS